MRPTETNLCNLVLTGEDVVSSEGVTACIDLPVWIDSEKVMTSFWMPSKAELALLNDGMPVQISIKQDTHPPIMVGVSEPG